MSGRQARRLVKEEQLGPTAAPHDRAAKIAPVQGADQPRPAGPATFQQCASLRIVDNASISGEVSSLRRRDNVAQRCNAILERHDLSPETQVSWRRGHTGRAGLHIGIGSRSRPALLWRQDTDGIA